MRGHTVKIEGTVDLNEIMDKLAEGDRLQAIDYENQDRYGTWTETETFLFEQYLN